MIENVIGMVNLVVNVVITVGVFTAVSVITPVITVVRVIVIQGSMPLSNLMSGVMSPETRFVIWGSLAVTLVSAAAGDALPSNWTSTASLKCGVTEGA